ncbi:MAG: hypothetical protein AAF411_15845 [Myxococcota bacterium]
MDLQHAAAALVVGAACLFLVRRFFGPARPKKRRGPDVPLSNLTKKRK